MDGVKIGFRNLWGQVAMALVLLSSMGGCTEEETSAGSRNMVFRLSLPGVLEVNTRGGGTLNEVMIDNVWVVQYSTTGDGGTQLVDGTFLKAQYFDNSKLSIPKENMTIEVATSDFSTAASRFYVIANAGSDLFTEQTVAGGSGIEKESKLKAVTVDFQSSNPTLLSSGPLTSASAEGKLVVVAPLLRAFAKVNVTWRLSSDITSTEGANHGAKVVITALKVYNLPEKSALYARGGGALTAPYPDLSSVSGSVVEIKSTDGTSVFPVNTPRSFHMAENLRGTGTGGSFAEKNLTGKGPGDGGALTGCTYLDLEGTYTYPGATDAIGMKYRIYLGGNLMNDYNIQRGYLYDLTVNISGANSADVRVTITDGNVIMFDEVEIIPNEVNFR